MDSTHDPNLRPYDVGQLTPPPPPNPPLQARPQVTDWGTYPTKANPDAINGAYNPRRDQGDREGNR